MRIGIDARPIQGKFTGDATYWRGLIEGFSHIDTDDEIILYLDAGLPIPAIPQAKYFQAKPLRSMSWRTWSVFAFPRALKKDGIDIAHVQYSIPLYAPCPVVTSVHDISFKRHPEFFRLKDRLILDAGFKRASKRAAKILALSEYTKKEMLDLYDIRPEKIAVVYPGVDEQFKPMDRDICRATIADKYGVSSPFILTLGVIQPRKNLPRLLEGFAKLKEADKSAPDLVIVGKYGWKETNLLERIAELKLSEHVILTGYAPQEDLPVFYNAADVFIYPSVYEGFGLPPLEAMACGTPVITGNQTSLPEVIGEAGIMVGPYDPAAFTKALVNVLSNETLRAEMSSKGLKQASKFTWDKTATQVLEIYRRELRSA